MSVTEGTTATGYTATATDANSDTLAYSISGGADQALFTIDSASGVLSFANAPEVDNPADANTDNDYEVQLTVDDGRSGTDTLDLVITVTGQSNFSLLLTFPTPNGNLGGGVTQTTVRGLIVDSNGAPINLADIDSVDVNGVTATLDATNPGSWSAQIPVTEGPNALALELRLTGGDVVQSNVTLQNFVAHAGLTDSVIDSANNRVLVIDIETNAVVGVDLSTGERTVVSSAAVGSGTNFISLAGITLDTANNRALVVDWSRDALTAVNLATGDRTEVSGALTGTGPSIINSTDVVIDAANSRALVAAFSAKGIIAVDLGTGDRTTISDSDGLDNSGTTPIGTGPELDNLQGIALDTTSNRALVSASYNSGTGLIDAIMAIDLTTGNRTILSDESTGTGPDLSSPLGLVTDTANNRLLVADQTQGLFSIDLSNGNRTVIDAPTDDYGVNSSRIQSVSINSAGDTAFVPDREQDAIFAVDLASGDRSVLSSSYVGSGSFETDTMAFAGIAYDPANNRVLATNPAYANVIGTDLGSADRVVVSSGTVGTGPLPGSLRRPDIDGDANRLIIPEGSTPAAARLVAMDLDTGNRTVVSDNAGIGAGPAFGALSDVAVDPTGNRAIVLTSSLGLFEVDLLTGDRSIVSDSVTGAGPLWAFPDSVDIDTTANLAYVADDGDTVIYRVNLTTGDRTVLSDNAGTGSGPSITFPNDLALDLPGNRALILNRGSRDEVMAVDLTTGDRSIVSGEGVGNGQAFRVPYYIDLDLANDRAFVFDLSVTGIIVVDLATGDRAVVTR